jgi:hypothetical protein
MPVAINASGQSVGSSETLNRYDAVLWQPTGKGLMLQNVSSLHQSDAVAVNNLA